MKTDKQAYKYAQIKTDLSIQILEGQLRPHDRIPSLNEIVERYRVSKITARRVLNDLVAEGLVYASRGRGSFVTDMATRSPGMRLLGTDDQLGVVFEHASGAFMGDIILGIDEEAFSRKAQITLCLSNNCYEREAENLKRLARQGISKVLLFIVLHNEEHYFNPNIPLYMNLQEQGMKLLLLVCNIPGFPVPSVTYDDYDAFRRLVKFMKDKGRRRLAYITRINNASTTGERLRGFKDGLLEHGMPYDENRILHVKGASPDTVVSDSCDCFAEFLRSGAGADAVICSDEMVAGGVFNAIDASGKYLQPAKLLVGGMGSTRNLHVLRGHPYVMLEGDTHRLGRTAAELILGGQLPGAGETSSEAFHFKLPVPLRVPKSLK
jgi:GntR family transcriptional regulator of arabinose operon